MSTSTFTITYSKEGTIAPVFVAGSFSSPPWKLHELLPDAGESHTFSKTFSAPPGTYQYKYRLGTGDWWVVDDGQATVTDEQGNVNNTLTIEQPTREIDHPDNSAADVVMPKPSIGPKISDDDAPQWRPLKSHQVTPEAQAASSPQVHDQAQLQIIEDPSSKSPLQENVLHNLPTPPLSEAEETGDSSDPLEDAARSGSGRSDPVRNIGEKVAAQASSKGSVAWDIPG